MKTRILFFAIFVTVSFFILLRPITSHAQVTCISQAAPISWDDPNGWSCNAVPTMNDTVIIESGHFKFVNLGDAAAATLIISGTLEMGNNSVMRSLTVGGDVTINSGGIFRSSTMAVATATHSVNIGGNITNDGTFDARTTADGTDFDVFLDGTGLQTIGGSNPILFNSLTISDTATVGIPAGATQPTVEGTLTNNGTLSQTQSVNNANVVFLEITDNAGVTNKYRGVEVNASGSGDNLGNVTAIVEVVDFSGGEFCTTTGMASPIYADRCYNISAANTGTAVIRLWALNSELNGIAEGDLAVYHNTGGTTWVELTTNQANGNDGGSYSFGEGETTGFSPFLLASNAAPTAVIIQDFDATNNSQPIVGVGAFTLLVLVTAGFWMLRRGNDL